MARTVLQGLAWPSMAAPRVFVSSTAYDLGHARGQLRSAILALSYEPVLSEYADILYDPRDNAQASCLKELASCDAMVLIVGSRFGSVANPSALAQIDDGLLAAFEAGGTISAEDASRVSITQIELLKAVQDGLPVFAFVEERVLHDHATYVANREKSFADEIDFASISQPEFARYIFTFLDFLEARVVNNAIFPFSRIEDIETTLKRQWASLFQRLLTESRQSNQRTHRVDTLSEQLEDLKVAILSSMGDTTARDVARSTIQFRLLIDIVSSLNVSDLRGAVEQGISWEDLLERAGVEEILETPADEGSTQRVTRVVLRIADDGLLLGQMSTARFGRLADEWAAFVALPPSQRMAVFDGVTGSDVGLGPRFVKTSRYAYDHFSETVYAVTPKKTPDPVYGDEEPF